MVKSGERIGAWLQEPEVTWVINVHYLFLRNVKTLVKYQFKKVITDYHST